MPAPPTLKVLAVCLGNICRSPLAEALIRQAASRADQNWEVASAGTGNWHVGNPPDPRSRAVAREHGLSIDAQRAQQATPQLLAQYDLILAMDRKNYQNLRKLAQTAEQRDKIKLLLDHVGLSEESGPDVFDPYWDDSGFEGVFQLLEKAASRLVALEVSTHQK